MISVCIPIHNYYVFPLAQRIRRQSQNLGVEVEIVCIDDFSSSYYTRQNQGLSDFTNYVCLAQNIGRARIRNLFLRYAKGDWLLFLDNDMVVPDNFMKTYVKALESNTSVVVGGISFDPSSDDREHHLRFLYSSKVESRSLETRMADPYSSFMTGNFMIRRDVFVHYHFDSSISKYGHEDTLLGYRLRQNKVPILHIDNPAINGQIETNVEFLHKTSEAVENLAIIYDTMWEDQTFCRSVRLLDTYGRLRRMKMIAPIYRLFRLTRKNLEKKLVSGVNIHLWQLNFYKLGLFIHLTR